MTPLAVRLRDLADRCRTKKLRATGGLLLSYRECEAVLALLDAAKKVLKADEAASFSEKRLGELAADLLDEITAARGGGRRGPGGGR